MVHLQGSCQNIQGTALTAAPNHGLLQWHLPHPSALCSQQGSLHAFCCIHCRPEFLHPALLLRSGYSYRQAPHTDPGSSPPALLQETVPVPWHLPPGYNKLLPHGKDVYQVCLRCQNSNHFLPMEPLSGKRGITPKSARYPPSGGLAAAPVFLVLHSFSEMPDILLPKAFPASGL